MHKHGLQPLAQAFCEKEDLVENVKVWWHPTAHGAKHVDFFLHDWPSKEIPFLTPPFTIIAKVLARLNQLKRRAIIVCPNWTTAPWYGLFLEMAKKGWVWHPPRHVPLFVWLGDNQPVRKPSKLYHTACIAYILPV